MDIKTAVLEALKELIVPDLDELKSDVRGLKAIQQVTNKRIDDLNGHSLDHSRSLDQVRNEIDQLRTELTERIDSLNNSLSTRIDVTNERFDRLYDVIVRREEHEDLKRNLLDFGRRLERLEEKVAVIG
jgi:chromosome segregation ATPase